MDLKAETVLTILQLNIGYIEGKIEKIEGNLQASERDLQSLERIKDEMKKQIKQLLN